MSGRHYSNAVIPGFKKVGAPSWVRPQCSEVGGLAKAHFWANVILCSAFALASASYLAQCVGADAFHAILSEVTDICDGTGGAVLDSAGPFRLHQWMRLTRHGRRK